MALALPGTEEYPHFNRIAFRIVKKKTFATLLEKENTANIMLSLVDQSVFCTAGKGAVYPVPNKWGLQGATTFELKDTPKSLIRDALETAYQEVIKNKAKKQ